MQLERTSEQQLIFLNTHWGRRYTFTALKPSGKWLATPNFGQHNRLEESSATELLLAVATLVRHEI
jgi:hypothetical protein